MQKAFLCYDIVMIWAEIVNTHWGWGLSPLLAQCHWVSDNSWVRWITLHWRHNDHDGVSNHQPHGCLLTRLLRGRSKKTSKLRVTGLCGGNSPGSVNSPHKGPVTRKMFPFDDVIINWMHSSRKQDLVSLSRGLNASDGETSWHIRRS